MTNDRAMAERLEATELRCRVLTAALRGFFGQLAPKDRVAVQRAVNNTVLSSCSAAQQAPVAAVLADLFPDSPVIRVGAPGAL
jgi:hypothetical protein